MIRIGADCHTTFYPTIQFTFWKSARFLILTCRSCSGLETELVILTKSGFSMDRSSGYASNCRMNIDKNARISIIASERPGQSVEPPPNGRKAARGISGFSSRFPDWKRLGSKLDASGPQTCRSLCTTAAGIWIKDPALSRYWPSRKVSSVV